MEAKMAAQEKVKAVAYLRTNKNEVAEQFDDLYEQYKNIRKYTEANQITIVASFEETPDAEKSKLYDILEYCRANKDISTVMATAQTRITRSLETFSEWESMFETIGVKFKFTQQSIAGNFDQVLQQITACLSGLDTKTRVAYIKRGLHARVAAGYSVQKPPLGYAKGVTRGVFVQTNTASLLRCEISKFLSGKQSVQDLKSAVSRMYSAGKTLSNSRFKAIIANPYYAGYVSHDGKQYKGLHEPLLTVAEHKKLISLLGK